MKLLILSLTFGFVFFTIATLVTNSHPVLAKGNLTGTISEFCIHARMQALDNAAQGLRVNYGPELIKTCGELN